MLNPPAEYNAAKANPITVALTNATIAAATKAITGISAKGHRGGLVRLCTLVFLLANTSAGEGSGNVPG